MGTIELLITSPRSRCRAITKRRNKYIEFILIEFIVLTLLDGLIIALSGNCYSKFNNLASSNVILLVSAVLLVKMQSLKTRQS